MSDDELTESFPAIESRSPSGGELLGSVLRAEHRDVEAAVDRAAHVQRLWAALRTEDRARYMARAAQAVIDEVDDLVDLISREQGRPRAEVEVMEILPAVETLQWLAERGPQILAGERLGFSRSQHPFKRGRWTYEPLGVVAVLSPAAEPFATPLGDVAVALMAGNGVVLKPSPFAVMSSERIARIFARAGLPEGLLRVVHGFADAGGWLVDAPVAQVRFTGNASAGRAVAEKCARALKRSVLELGGNDPALILADANLEKAVRGVAWAAFANAGQSSGSVGRAICVHKVADEFLADIVDLAGALQVGDPRNPSTDIGPLVTTTRLDRCVELLDDAVAHGATVHCGGPKRRPGLPGAFFAPTVLSGAGPEARLWREHAPGPILTVLEASSESEAIRLANASPFGLGASVWTADRFKGERVARELQAGMVWMNDHLVARSAPQVPWGGVKGSGFGRARGAVALRTCAEPKVVTWDPSFGRPAWWFPYDATLVRAGRAVVGLRSARAAEREQALKHGWGPLASTTVRWLRTLRSSRD